MLPQYTFGPGVAWVSPVQDYQGNAISNPSPALIAAVQDVSVDFGAEMKELHGTSAFALAIARGKQKVDIKVKNGQVNGTLWNSTFFGQFANQSAGVYDLFYDQTGTAVPSTPFQITPATTYAAQLKGTSPTYLFDLGVRDINNLPLQRVASGPTTRQYSVSGGVYTFASADVGIVYYISFAYTATSTVAQTLAIANPVMGATPLFQFSVKVPYAGNALVFNFPNCTSGKLSLATKLDDFAYPEFDIGVMAPGSANVGTVSWSQ